MSASLGLSPVLSPTLSPIWSGMLCPPRWSCLSLVCGLVSGLVCHLGWDAVSASLGCLQLVSHLVWDALSASLVLSFSCLWSCLPAFVFVLSRSLSFIWDAVSAPPGLVFFLSLVLCLAACLGCCVRLFGSSPSPACLRSFVPSCFPAGLVCPCSGLVSKISCAICATVWGLRWCNFFFIFYPIRSILILIPRCLRSSLRCLAGSVSRPVQMQDISSRRSFHGRLDAKMLVVQRHISFPISFVNRHYT